MSLETREPRSKWLFLPKKEQQHKNRPPRPPFLIRLVALVCSPCRLNEAFSNKAILTRNLSPLPALSKILVACLMVASLNVENFALIKLLVFVRSLFSLL